MSTHRALQALVGPEEDLGAARRMLQPATMKGLGVGCAGRQVGPGHGSEVPDNKTSAGDAPSLPHSRRSLKDLLAQLCCMLFSAPQKLE